MTQYLLAISIGPVQDFISASRRTNDLYAGSQLLVNIAKVVAKYVGEKGVGEEGKLIFPAEVTDEAPNKILVLLNVGEVPEMIADGAKQAAKDFLNSEWKKVKVDGIVAGLAEEQIENFLEFYAAWVPLKNYEEDRITVDRLLAGRKALRDFTQPKLSEGRPKSPLDPSRECVLPVSKQAITEECLQKLKDWRLKKTETLDAISVLKRFSGQKSHAPSTSAMAIRTHLPSLNVLASDEMIEIQQLVKGTEWMLDDAFLRDSWEGTDDSFVREIKKLSRSANHKLSKANVSAPQPYYAILVADGDRMGKIIGGLKAREEHQALSGALSKFASEAREIVEKHLGHPVYTGGDDVLALLPVNSALDCAKALAEEFKIRMKPLLEKSGSNEGGTLSVGVAIVHHLENLQLSLQHARDAEGVAKLTRNSLAVALHTRGGAPMTVSEKWDEKPDGTAWEIWIKAFGGGLSRGFPYELRGLVKDWKGCYEGSEKIERLRQEVVRILKRKKGEEGGSKVLEKLLSYCENPKENRMLVSLDSYEKWESFANRLVIARFLATFPGPEVKKIQEKNS